MILLYIFLSYSIIAFLCIYTGIKCDNKEILNKNSKEDVKWYITFSFIPVFNLLLSLLLNL